MDASSFVAILALIGLAGCALVAYGVWDDYKHPEDRYADWRADQAHKPTRTELGKLR
jgi:hypothetical protein